MDKNNLNSKIIEIISNNVTGNPIITDETRLVDININSLNFLKIIVDIEDEYGIEFDEDEMGIELFKDVESLANFIERKMSI